MFKQLVPISREKHARKKVKAIDSFAFSAQFQIASVMVHEFTRAATTYPLVFIEDTGRGALMPVALLGLEAQENLFVDASGRWHASYVPAIIRRYPFALADTGQAGQLAVCIDEGSPLVGDTEGQPLFGADGEPTEVISGVKRYLGELQQMDTMTREFCGFLKKHDLFAPFTMQVRSADRLQNIAGCNVVNEQRLAGVPDEAFLEMRRRGYLPAIYAHLVSLGQLHRLVMLKDERVNGIKGATPGAADA